MVEKVKIVDEKKMAADAANHDMILRDIYVPNSMCTQLAEKYNMLSKDSVIGKDISSLRDLVNSDNTITPHDANKIMFITMSGILYGAYEYFCDKNIKDEAKSILTGIVGKVENYSGEILCGSHEKSHILCSDLRYSAYWYHADNINSVIPQHAPYSTKNFVGDFMTMFYKNLGHYSSISSVYYPAAASDWHAADNYSFKCIARYQNGGKVHKVCDFIRTVKCMGDKYVCAPAINLYADAVLAQIYEAYKVHRGNLVYPSTWKPRRR